MNRFLHLLWLCCAASALASFARAGVDDRKSDDVLSDLSSARRAMMQARQSGGTAAKEYREAAQHVADLIAELAKLDPHNAQLEGGLQERWAILTKLFDQTDAVDSEIRALLEKEPDGPFALVARLSLVRERIAAAREFDAAKLHSAEEALTALLEKHASSPQAGDALYEYATFRTDDPHVQLENLRRLVKDFPGHRSRRVVDAQIALLERFDRQFELDFTDAISQKPMSVKALKGKVVVIDFWATWCHPCMSEMPHMKELYAKFKDQGVEFIGVSLDKSEAEHGLEDLKKVVARDGLSWPQYYQGKGWESEFSGSWGVTSIPCVFVVGADGKLVSNSARGRLETILPRELAKAKK